MNLLNHPLFLYMKKNQQLAIFIAILVSVVMVLYAFLGYKPKYVSEAQVLVRESVLTSKYITTDERLTTSSALTNPILNNLNLLKTNEVSDSLWQYLKTKHPDALEEKHVESTDDWEDFFNGGASMIKAKNVPGTDIIGISFSWNDPTISQEGLQAVLAGFKNASLKINQSEQIERAKYLEQQADEIRTQLAVVRAKVMNFKRRENTVNIAKDTENYSKSRIDFDAAMKVAMAEAQAKQGEMRRYQSVLGMSPSEALRGTALGGDPTTAKLHDQLYTLKEQQAQYTGRYTEKHPAMRQLTSQITQLEKDIQQQGSRSLGFAPGKKQVYVGDETRFGAIKSLVQANSEATALSIKAGMLNKYLHEIDSKIQSLPEIEATLAKYQDEEGVLSQSLGVMQQKALEAKIRGAQSLSNIYVIDPPKYPRNASFPTPFHICILGLFVGALSGISLVLLKYKLEELLGREIVVNVPNFGGVVASVKVARDKKTMPKMGYFKP